MNDNIPIIELPEFATIEERLSHAIEVSRDAVTMRVGYEVEVAGLEPIEREGHTHLRIYWRRKKPELHVIN